MTQNQLHALFGQLTRMREFLRSPVPTSAEVLLSPTELLILGAALDEMLRIVTSRVKETSK